MVAGAHVGMRRQTWRQYGFERLACSGFLQEVVD